MLGAILFPLVGQLIGAERTPAALLVRGARFGSFYFMIWSPAIALSASVMRVYRRKHPRAEQRAASAARVSTLPAPHASLAVPAAQPTHPRQEVAE